MNTRKTGQHYEEKAAEYLQQQGYRIIERNYRCRGGEIDIIAWHEAYLVFVEVKYRATKGSGEPVAAVDFNKQKKICSVAKWYMMERKYGDDTKCRFDVVGIQAFDTQVYQNAFDFTG